MSRFWGVFVLASVFLPMSACGDWGLPNPPSTAIGESGTFYLSEPGLFFDFHNNDWIGQTDKLVTYSSALAWLRPLQTKKEASEPTPEAFKLSLGSRLLTPIIKTRFDTKELKPHVGVFAEWLELQLAYSRIFGRFKTELSFASDFFGKFNGDGLYHYIHEAFSSPDYWDEFGPRYEGSYGATSMGIGYVWSDFLLSMIYYDKNKVMEDFTVATNFLYKFNSKVTLAAENRFVIQRASEIYENPRSHRHEWGVGLKWSFWQIHFKYVSPYLKEDRYGQYFVSPLIFNWSF